jgi:hypothetical protein
MVKTQGYSRRDVLIVTLGGPYTWAIHYRIGVVNRVDWLDWYLSSHTEALNVSWYQLSVISICGTRGEAESVYAINAL